MWDIEIEPGLERGQARPGRTYWWLDDQTLRLPGEQWRPWAPRPILTISSLGRVYDIAKERFVKPLLLNRHQRDQFYIAFQHTYRKQRLQILAHRAVGITYLPNPQNLPIVNHINNDPLDNTLVNLEWTSAKENHRHASRALQAPRRTPVKFTFEQVMDMHRAYLAQGVSAGELARRHDVRVTTITNILKGRSWPLAYQAAQCWRDD